MSQVLMCAPEFLCWTYDPQIYVLVMFGRRTLGGDWFVRISFAFWDFLC